MTMNSGCKISKVFSYFLAASLIGSVLLSSVASASQIYINVGEAKRKESNLALPSLNFMGTGSVNATAAAAGAELYNVIKNDLTVSSLFQMMSQAAYLEDVSKTSLKPKPGDPAGFDFAKWKTVGAEFLIRGGYRILGNETEFEGYLYYVPKGEMIFGKKYKGTSSAGRRIAHSFANDVLKELTGTAGPFLSRLVVASDRDGGGYREIYVMDWDGFGPTKISNHRSVSMSPAWSPDGTKVAYTAFVLRGRSKRRNADMFMFDLPTGKRSLISYRQGFNSGANFDPDNKSMYLTISQGNSPNIYKMRYDGTLEAQLTKGPLGAMNVEPAISPDGQKLAFSSDRARSPMIYIMNADGSSPQRLTFAGVFNSTPSWSPDGKKIAFAGQSENNFDVFIMNADGSGIARVTSARRTNGKMANHEDPTFSPDGRYVMYTSNRTGKSQIYISTIEGTNEYRVTNDNFNYYRPKWSKTLE